jgi:tRNA (guanosine-2'-O-)-methyltransferase
MKEAGYRLLATHLDGGVPLEEIDFSERTALVFGSEGRGVCDELLEHCDGRVIIPMSGFSQSFNVSVAAAMCLHQARMDRVSRLGRFGDLTEEEAAVVRERYYRRSIQCSDAILSRK